MIDDSGGAGREPSLAFSPDGTAFISYYKNTSPTVLKVAKLKEPPTHPTYL